MVGTATSHVLCLRAAPVLDRGKRVRVRRPLLMPPAHVNSPQVHATWRISASCPATNHRSLIQTKSFLSCFCCHCPHQETTREAELLRNDGELLGKEALRLCGQELGLLLLLQISSWKVRPSLTISQPSWPEPRRPTKRARSAMTSFFYYTKIREGAYQQVECSGKRKRGGIAAVCTQPHAWGGQMAADGLLLFLLAFPFTRFKL